MKKQFYLFIAITTFILIGLNYAIGTPTFTPNVVMLGVLFLALVTIITFSFSERTVNHENPNKFVRMVMGMTMLKFLLCIVGVAIMLFSLGKSLHKPDLYLLMAFYLIYTIGEAMFLSQLAKTNKKN